jgi:hypothetical protein
VPAGRGTREALGRVHTARGRFGPVRYLVLMPSLHFWSSPIGKDSTLMFCIGGFAWSVVSPRRIPLAVPFLFLAYLVRPHIVVLLVAAAAFGAAVGRGMPLFRRLLLVGALGAAVVVVLPRALEFAQLDSTSTEDLENFADRKASVLGRSSGSRVDIRSYSLPYQVFTFFFRPLPYDINGLLSLVVSIENTVFLYIFMRTLLRFRGKLITRMPFIVTSLIVFAVVGAAVMAPSLSNLGILTRMRNMSLPGLLLWIAWVESQTRGRPAGVTKRPRLRPVGRPRPRPLPEGSVGEPPVGDGG